MTRSRTRSKHNARPIRSPPKRTSARPHEHGPTGHIATCHPPDNPPITTTRPRRRQLRPDAQPSNATGRLPQLRTAAGCSVPLTRGQAILHPSRPAYRSGVGGKHGLCRILRKTVTDERPLRSLPAVGSLYQEQHPGSSTGSDRFRIAPGKRQSAAHELVRSETRLTYASPADWLRATNPLSRLTRANECAPSFARQARLAAIGLLESRCQTGK